MLDKLTALYSVWEFLQSPAGAGIFAGLWAISEALASIPSISANSVFQAISNVIKKIAGK